MAIAYNRNYSGTQSFSDTCVQIALGTGVEQTYTVPGTSVNQYRAEFSYNSTSNVWVRNNAAPTSPSSGTITTQNYSELRPMLRQVQGGDVLHFITPDSTTTYVGVSLMSITV